ncbi:MAG: nucleotidyltransferase domain-containing protein [Candidatus Caldarchaeum sp.]|uniref:Nucleotidyltransferase domain-containing protein n=1 Tax=Caldiarchaeum subterraneum TaxID=311458 RepID=A0A7C4I6K0_CALS0|nr:nucleotidyltransferase domain-containing protein [Candidatus Caldarchaeales archaeon]
MSTSWVNISRKLSTLKEKEFEAVRDMLCGDSVLVILFGSRARGEATPLSDYDVLAIKKQRSDRVVLKWPAQIFNYTVDEVFEELLRLNTLVLDAVLEGIFLCGDEKLFEELRREAETIVERRRLKKAETGWVSRAVLRDGGV